MKSIIVAIVVAVPVTGFAQPQAVSRSATQLTSEQYGALAATEQRCVDAIEVRKQDGRLIRTVPIQASPIAHYYCEELAKEIVDTAPDSMSASVVQPTITDTPGAQASAGQTAAVSSGQPVAIAGGSVAAVGDIGSGLQMVTALAINPATIATGESSTVWASRTVDLSIVLPLNLDPAEGQEKGFQYIGGRFRINAFPLIEKADVEKSYRDLLGEFSAALDTITEMLEAASDPDACAAAIASRNAARQTTDCGRSYDSANLERLDRTARQSLDALRDQTDRKYLSLEGRFDRGDLNADTAEDLDNLFAVYASAGYIANPTAAGLRVGVNGRGGVVFYKDGLMDKSQVAYHASVGIELELVRSLQRYGLSAGVELNKRIGDDDGIETDLENKIRIGLALPAADGKTVSVGISIPTDGGEPTVALSGDWSLLLGR